MDLDNLMPMRMWLDDRRPPRYPDWQWVTTGEEAIEHLKTGKVVAASLDHDLGMGITGYDVVAWMEEHNVWPPEGVRVHSMNLPGRDRIQMVIDKYNANPSQTHTNSL